MSLLKKVDLGLVRRHELTYVVLADELAADGKKLLR